MQRKDIRTGVLYAKGQGHRLAPAFVLDTATLWKRTTGGRTMDDQRRRITWEPVTDTRAGRRGGRYGYSAERWGLLAAIGAEHYNRDRHEEAAETVRTWLANVADPHTLTPDTVAALATGAPEGIEITIIESRDLIGEWDSTLAGIARAERIEREWAAEAERERKRLEAVGARVAAVWRERFGEEVPFNYNVYDDTARIPIDRLAALIGLTDD
jgi:hypothetical protein